MDALETFLRGMETYGSDCTAFLPNSLETFLRGMETRQPCSPRLPQSPLKPSLEGWKLGLAASLPCRTAVP